MNNYFYNNFLMQFQSDMLDCSVVRPQINETTALGAAYLAGIATGFWSGADEVAAQWVVDRRFEPRLKASGRAEKLARWRQAVDRSKGWAEK